MTNSEIWGSNAASAQYLLQLTSYLGMPVIAWNADNIGLDQVSDFLAPLSTLTLWSPSAKCPFSYSPIGALDGAPGERNA